MRFCAAAVIGRHWIARSTRASECPRLLPQSLRPKPAAIDACDRPPPRAMSTCACTCAISRAHSITRSLSRCRSSHPPTSRASTTTRCVSSSMFSFSYARAITRAFLFTDTCILFDRIPFICFSIFSLFSTFRVASRCGGICGSCRSLLPAKKTTLSRLLETGGWRRWSNSTAMMTRAPFCQCHIHRRATRLPVVRQKNRCGPDVAALCDIWGATRAAFGRCSTCSLYTNGSTRPESKSAANRRLSFSALNLPLGTGLELPNRQKRHNAYWERWRPSLRNSSAAATALTTSRKKVTTWRGTSRHVRVQSCGSGALITAWTNVSPEASRRIRAFPKFNFHQRVSAPMFGYSNIILHSGYVFLQIYLYYSFFCFSL